MSKTKIVTTKIKAKVGTIKARVATTKIQTTATMASKVMNLPRTMGALITMVHTLSTLNTLVMQKITIHTTSMCKILSTKHKKLNCHLTAKVVAVQVMAVHFLQIMASDIAMAMQVMSVVIVITDLLSKQMVMIITDMTAVIITAAITDDRQDGLR